MPGQFSVGAGYRLFVFCGVALLAWAGWTAWLWRRGGAGRHVLARSGFALYLVLAWLLVLMPFPDESVLRDPAPVNLVPFGWLADASAGVRYVGGGLGAWLTNRTVVYVFSNVLLTMPFGAYLRRAHRWGAARVALAALGLSLAFELTQLTAVWGIAGTRYRTFDVDDLIANTAGALLGWLFVPLLRAWPQRRAGQGGAGRPTPLRRALALLLDVVAWQVGYLVAWLVVWTVVSAAGGTAGQPVALALWAATGVAVLAGCPLLAGGATPGALLLDLPGWGRRPPGPRP